MGPHKIRDIHFDLNALYTICVDIFEADYIREYDHCYLNGRCRDLAQFQDTGIVGFTRISETQDKDVSYKLYMPILVIEEFWL